MIANIINNKNLNSIVTELFFRGRKLNISVVFITHFQLFLLQIHTLKCQKMLD